MVHHEDHHQVEVREEAILRRLGDTVEVAPLVVRWNGQIPEPFFDTERIVGTIAVDDLLTSAGQDQLEILLAKAARRREASFRRCKSCGESKPPEHREGGICHSCMEAQGVVF